MDLRTFNRIALACVALAAMGSATAQTGTPAAQFPAKPMRLIVPYPPGGGSDVLSRVVGASMGEQLGQPVVIENKPGGATIVGAEAAAQSPADGYTLFLGNVASLAVNPSLFKGKLPYDPNRDFKSVGMMGRFGMILVVNPSVKANTLAEFVELAKRGGLNYGSPGIGSPHHLAMELLKERTRVDIAHIVYKGAAPAVQDVVSGQIQAMVLDTGANAKPLIDAGKLRAIAVFSDKRLPGFENVPTTVESGFPDLQVWGWQGLVLPSATPDANVKKLAATLNKSLEDPRVANKLTEVGIYPSPMAPEAFDKYWRDEGVKWQALIEKAGIKAE